MTKTKEQKQSFMPQIIDLRLVSPLDSPVWNHQIESNSIKASGTTSKGSKVMLFSHIPSSLSIEDSVGYSATDEERKKIYQERNKDFHRLVSLDGKTDNDGNRLVWVFDYPFKAKYGKIPFEQVLEHPQTIPFIGSKEKAEKYLKKYKEISATPNIFISRGHGFYCHREQIGVSEYYPLSISNSGFFVGSHTKYIQRPIHIEDIVQTMGEAKIRLNAKSLKGKYGVYDRFNVHSKGVGYTLNSLTPDPKCRDGLNLIRGGYRGDYASLESMARDITELSDSQKDIAIVNKGAPNEISLSGGKATYSGYNGRQLTKEEMEKLTKEINKILKK